MAQTTSNIPSEAPTVNNFIEVAGSKKSQDISTLMSMVDILNGIYVDAKTILDQYQYPINNMEDLATSVSELTKCLSLGATYILDPKAQDVAPEIKQRIACGID